MSDNTTRPATSGGDVIRSIDVVEDKIQALRLLCGAPKVVTKLATISASAGSLTTFSGPRFDDFTGRFTSDMVGRQLVITGAGHAYNNGSRAITQVLSANVIRIDDSALPIDSDPNNGSLSWSVEVSRQVPELISPSRQNSLTVRDSRLWQDVAAALTQRDAAVNALVDRRLHRRRAVDTLPVRGWPGGNPSAAFDVTTLSLTALWRADYPVASWPQTASAGSSGSNGSLVAGHLPAAGATQNGKTPADFDGATHDLVNANATNTFVADGAGTVWVLFRADTAGADAGAGGRVDNQGLVFQDGGGVTWGISYSTAGVTALIYDGISYKEITIACATGAYHLAMMRWDGANIEFALDSGTNNTLACGNCTANAGTLVTGRNYSVLFFDGSILEIGMTNSRLSDDNRTNVINYANSQYGLSL